MRDRVAGSGKRDVGCAPAVRASARARRRVRSFVARLPASRFPLPALLLAFASCSWFTDFKRQPKIDPWESASDTVPFRANPQGSVPVSGTFVAGYQVSYAALPATVDSMSGIRNPTPPSDSSVANGRKYYQINCAVCHGEAGAGNGPATQYGMPGISLLTSITQNRTDGYIFGMIRNGRGLMPPYNRIEEMDRWDVVNYVRGLQGKLAAKVAVGPVGLPGQTGATVPGYSRMGPTRPVPYYHPNGTSTMDALRVDAQGPAAAAAAAGDTVARGTPPSALPNDSAARSGRTP